MKGPVTGSKRTFNIKRKHGPRMPGELLEAMRGNRGEDGDEGARGGLKANSASLPRGVSMFHVTNRRERRKLERQQKKLKKAPVTIRSTAAGKGTKGNNRNSNRKGGAKAEGRPEGEQKAVRAHADPTEAKKNPKRPAEDAVPLDGAAPAPKKAKGPVAEAEVVRSGRLDSEGRFLPAVSRELFEEDLRLERRMAKLLGLTKKSKKRIGGPEDGLEGLLAGIEAADATAWPGQGARSREEEEEEGVSGGSDEEGAGQKEGLTVTRRGSVQIPRHLSDEDYLATKRRLREERERREQEGEGVEEGSEESSSDEDGSLDSEEDDGDGTESDEEGSDNSSITLSGGGAEEEEGDGDEEERGGLPSVRGAASAGGKYVPPALRARMSQGSSEAEKAEDADVDPAVARRIRGLLNRLAEANLQGIVGDLLALYQEHGRRAVIRIVASDLLAASAEGPRATEQFAAVSAACIAGFASLSGSQEVAAVFLAGLAERFSRAQREGDSITTRNLTLVLAFLFSSGIVSAGLLFSFLGHLQQGLEDDDVSCIVTALNACGLALRSQDPVAMKDFVIAVHKRAGDKGASLSKRAELMLDLVCDIKNNKRKEGAAGGRTASLSPAVLKWLKSQCRVEEHCLRSLTWHKLLLPASERRGIWWTPRAGEALEGDIGASLVGTGDSSAVAAATQAALQQLEATEGGMTQQQLLALAAKMRMNTDNRRAIFCIVMGSEDFVDCAEKLLRLPLKGEQEREIVRVLLECCLQEASYNPYYAHVAVRLAAVSRGHKMTLQFALWDHLKRLKEDELTDKVDPRRTANLARLLASLLASFTLPISSLKVADMQTAGATETSFWRLALFHTLLEARDNADVEKIFSRLAGHAQLASLRTTLKVFVRTKLGPWIAEKHAKAEENGNAAEKKRMDSVLLRARLAEKALSASSSSVGLGLD